jgi:hypothetical protein
MTKTCDEGAKSAENRSSCDANVCCWYDGDAAASAAASMPLLLSDVDDAEGRCWSRFDETVSADIYG